MDRPKLGLALILSSFLQPNIAICGLVGGIVSLLLLQGLGATAILFRRLVVYNGLLTGFFVGYLFKFDIWVFVLLACAVALCLSIAAVLDSIFRRQGLPVLSLPFTFTAIALSLAKFQLSNLTDATPYFLAHSFPFQGLSSDFFVSVGCLFCIPDPIFGLLIFALISLFSPLLGLFIILGFSFGVGWEMLFRLPVTDAHATHFFNYSLTFSGVALVFLRPSRKTLALAGVAIGITGLVVLSSMTYWSSFQIPIVPFAFNVTALLVLRSASWIWPGQLLSTYTGSPEKTLEQSRLYRLRQRSGEIGVYCPFEGSWVIQQGFSGAWTHQGNWKYAIYFVVLDTHGKTFKEQGHQVEDYHCFGQWILSPIEGYIVATLADQEDNRIGTVNNAQNWGNYIIVKSNAGYYVVLAHLKKSSIAVKVGEYVLAGAKLARCGNSGY